MLLEKIDPKLLVNNLKLQEFQNNTDLGLVLAGGGSRGSYELGVIKALNELKIDCKYVSGSSIGALNAYMYVKGDYQEFEDLWRYVTEDQIFVDFKEFKMDSSAINSTDIFNFLFSKMKEKPTDISPFISLLDRHMNPEFLKETDKVLAITALNIDTFKGEYIILNHLDEKLVREYLIATSSCFPIFPAHHIDSRRYFDGGYFDNLPINLTFNLGAKKLIAVDLIEFGTRLEYALDDRVLYLIPRHNLASFFNFSKESKFFNAFLGYTDLYKSFNLLVGYRYSFFSDPKLENYSTEFYLRNKRFLRKYRKQFLKVVLLKEELNVYDYFLLALEEIALYLKIDFLKIYDLHEFITLIRDRKNEIKDNLLLLLFNSLIDVIDEADA